MGLRPTHIDEDFVGQRFHAAADIIVSIRRLKEPGRRISLDELLAEAGIPRRRRSA